MKNTIQLYADEAKKVKGYPITSPDRVIDANGKSVKTILESKANKQDVINISSGTPIFTDSISKMTDKTKIYVNITDGFIYTVENGTFKQSGIKYQEKGLSNGQVTEEKTSFYKKTLNLENKNLQVQNQGIDTNTGELYENHDLVSTETYIDINCQYLSLEKFNKDGVSNGSNETILIAFYTKDLQFIKAVDIHVNNYISVPTTAVKIRYQIMKNLFGYDFNLYPTKELQDVYIKQYKLKDVDEIYAHVDQCIETEINKVNNAIDKIKNGELLKEQSITPNKTTFFSIVKNMFNPQTVSNGAILKDNGIFDTYFTEWRATDWIEVKAGTTIYFGDNGKPFTTHLGALYDTKKQYLSPIQDTDKVAVAQDGYMRVSQNGGFPSKYQIVADKLSDYTEYNNPKTLLKKEYLAIDTTEIYETIEDIKNSISNNNAQHYKNKSYLFMGDSITRLDMTESGWVKYFSEIMNPSKIVNIAVNGATWKDYSDTPSYDGNPTPENHLNVMGNQVQKVINEKARNNADYSNFDVIIMAAGTNDPFDRFTETNATVEDEFVTSYATGKYTVKSIDQVNRKTIPGAIRYAYEKLYALYPNAVFFVTTPLQEAYENYLDIKAKGDLIDYVADRLSITTINSRRCGILNTYESPVGDINYDNPTGSESTRKRDLSDGIHTNPSGAKKLGEFNAREVIKYFCF